jgi:RNA-directed DNA polymerase
MKKLDLKYDDIISIECLLSAWREFSNGKRGQNDVVDFEMHLMQNLFCLQADLANRHYAHGFYQELFVSDPKPRNIHKASVRDRVSHHLLYQALIAYFDRHFIFDSYSCRKDKGVLRAINQFRCFAKKASKNNTQTCHILKCDIRKFFASMNHTILMDIFTRHIEDADILKWLENIIKSFETNGKKGVGVPLGNLTSQLFANVYLNELDQFIKRHLKVKRYIRYADDFVIFSEEKAVLEEYLPKISDFLVRHLKLSLHEEKIFFDTWASGADFLGWVHFPYHRILRTTTKKKMFRNVKKDTSMATLASYDGLLSYGDAYTLKKLLHLF